MRISTFRCICLLVWILQAAAMLSKGQLFAQSVPAAANYDENKVPAYTLPDLLTATDGSKISDVSGWQQHRRPEILRLFETEMYGRTPGRVLPVRYQITSVDRQALQGKATRKQISIHFGKRPEDPAIHVLLYLPNRVRGRVPAFVGLNFNGNHAIHSDPGIALSRAWMRSSKDGRVVDNRATESSRGSEASRWAVEKILEAGFALASAYYGDIDPDYDDGFQNGVHPLLYRSGQTVPGPDEWGSIGAWAWGLSRILDCLEREKAVDARKVAVIGHSRLGKAALWAGAQDRRFALVVSNNSGCGGAALSKRIFGETVGIINKAFPHWFCANFRKYNDNESTLPMDQHMLLALIAPRPVYVASAEEDLWADPRGEFLAARQAGSVWRLYGKIGLDLSEMPGVHQPAGDYVGYHLRAGKHDVTDYDWQQYLSFARRHFTAK